MLRMVPLPGKSRGGLSRGAVGRQRLDRRTMDDFAVEGEARAVAGAVPAAVILVPADDAAHVGAGRRDGVQFALRVAVARDIVTVDLEDRGLARRQRVEAVRLLGQIASDQMRGDLGIALDEL